VARILVVAFSHGSSEACGLDGQAIVASRDVDTRGFGIEGRMP
jgi:hypothetical protein